MQENGVSIDEMNFHPEIKRTDGISEFSFEDLIFMEENGIGLRHIGKRELAQDNINNGFVGDAVALSGIGETFLEKFADRFCNNDEALKRLDLCKKYRVKPNLELMKDFFWTGGKTENR